MAACLWPVEEGYSELKNGYTIALNHSRGVDYFKRGVFPYGCIHDCPSSFRHSKMSVYLMARRVMAFRKCSFIEATAIATKIPDVSSSSSADELGLRYDVR